MFDDLESARFINSCIMLLASVGKQTSSSIVIVAMARKKENNEWNNQNNLIEHLFNHSYKILINYNLNKPWEEHCSQIQVTKGHEFDTS